jgi:hypothetical protein
VECIGKGKAHRPYEFGVKVSVATTARRSKGGQFVTHVAAQQLQNFLVFVQDLLQAAHLESVLERDHVFDLVMQILGQRRIRDGRAVGDDRVGRLRKEKRWIAHVMTHLADMFLVVAADASDAAHRKQFARVIDSDCRRCGRGNDIAWGAHGVLLKKVTV